MTLHFRHIILYYVISPSSYFIALHIEILQFVELTKCNLIITRLLLNPILLAWYFTVAKIIGDFSQKLSEMTPQII